MIYQPNQRGGEAKLSATSSMKEIINILFVAFVTGSTLLAGCAVAWLACCFILWEWWALPSILFRSALVVAYVPALITVALNADEDMPRIL